VPITGDYPGSLTAANCFPKLPAKLRASNVAGGQSGSVSEPVFTGHVGRFQKFGRADLKFWQTFCGFVVAFWAGIAPARAAVTSLVDRPEQRIQGWPWNINIYYDARLESRVPRRIWGCSTAGADFLARPG
jgi:hypothetical protein